MERIDRITLERVFEHDLARAREKKKSSTLVIVALEGTQDKEIPSKVYSVIEENEDVLDQFELESEGLYAILFSGCKDIEQTLNEFKKELEEKISYDGLKFNIGGVSYQGNEIQQPVEKNAKQHLAQALENAGNSREVNKVILTYIIK